MGRLWAKTKLAGMAEAGGEAGLVGPDDPAPFRWVNRPGRAGMLIVCDHASKAVPAVLDGLGLTPAALDRHIGWDQGAGAVAEHLARHFDAPAILAGFSRLAMDLNRYPDDPASILEHSDGTPIPGNQGLGAEAARARRRALFDPYHREIATALDGALARGLVPVVVSVHSFTPELEGTRRPQLVCVCWRDDQRLSRPVLAHLRAAGLDPGDNLPFNLDPGEDYTMIVHALERGLPHLMVELSRDEVGEADGGAGAARWAGVLAAALDAALETGDIRHIRRN